jgi:hypothetical protein|tara:strand:+ start:339 stop:878 length:540 start_codon:yes stop_codon:yes gene_type:complete
MAEAFSNKLARAVGVVNSSAAGAIGITTNKITGISTSGVTVGDLVDNQNYIAGTTISSIGVGQVVVDRDSTNTSSTTGQNVKFLQPSTIYTSPGSTKTILIGGTFANNTNGQVALTVSVLDNSTGITAAIASKIPVPAGSSFVISDTGKTLLEANDAIKVSCDTANAIDVNISILTGVN